MSRVPPENIGEEFNKGRLTRLFEDVYKRVGKVQSDTANDAIRMQSQIIDINNKLEVLEADNSEGPDSHMPIPSPTNLKTIKVGPLVVAWCDPVNPLEFTGIEGFQFFGSAETDYKINDKQSAVITYYGQTASDMVASTTEFYVSASKSTWPWRTHLYGTLPFWSDMTGLNQSTTTVTNVTKDESATFTATSWNGNDPLKLTTTALSGGAEWEAGDTYRFKIWRPPNMLGQGVFSFAVFIVPNGLFSGNPWWDDATYIVKARSYGRGGYSDTVSASTAGEKSEAPMNLKVAVFVNPLTGLYYYFEGATAYMDLLITFDLDDDATGWEIEVIPASEEQVTTY